MESGTARAKYHGDERRKQPLFSVNNSNIGWVITLVLSILAAVYGYGGLNDKVNSVTSDVHEIKQDVKTLMIREAQNNEHR